MLSSQNAQHQAGALVNVLIFVLMYSLKRQTAAVSRQQRSAVRKLLIVPTLILL